MAEVLEMIVSGSVLMLAVLGFADFVHCVVKWLLSLPKDMPEEQNLTVKLRNADTAEIELRNLLAKITFDGFVGQVEVEAEDEESFLIAGKILRKYPNIGLFYRGDLNYNI